MSRSGPTATAVAIMAAMCTLLVSFVMVSEPAAAQNPQTFESDPALAAGVDGPVWVTELVYDELWIGGDFLRIRNYDFNSPLIPSENLAVLNINTGLVEDKTFSVDGTVFGIAHHDRTVWVAGEFDTVNGQAHSNLVAFDAATGEVRPEFVGNSDNEIRDIVYHDGWLYVAGSFNTYNSQGVHTVIRVDPTTGDLDPSFDTNQEFWIESLDAQGDLLIVGERGAVGAGSYETEVFRISTGLRIDGLDTASGQGVWDAKFSPDGNRVFSASTSNRVEAFTTTDLVLWQSIAADGDMQAVAATDQWVIAGFHEGWRGDSTRRMVAFDPATGQETPWFVEMNSYWGVRDLRITDQGLVAAGEFSNVNGFNSRRVAIFRPVGGWTPAEPLDVEPTFVVGDVDCDNDADLLDARGVALYAIGTRTGVDACPVAAAEVFLPAGDVDGDDDADLIDARLIALCAIGVANTFCPG